MESRRRFEEQDSALKLQTQDLGLWTFPRRQVAPKASERGDKKSFIRRISWRKQGRQQGTRRPISRPRMLVTKAELGDRENYGEVKRSENQRKRHQSWLETGGQEEGGSTQR